MDREPHAHSCMAFLCNFRSWSPHSATRATVKCLHLHQTLCLACCSGCEGDTRHRFHLCQLDSNLNNHSIMSVFVQLHASSCNTQTTHADKRTTNSIPSAQVFSLMLRMSCQLHLHSRTTFIPSLKPNWSKACQTNPMCNRNFVLCSTTH